MYNPALIKKRLETTGLVHERHSLSRDANHIKSNNQNIKNNKHIPKLVSFTAYI